MGDMMPNMMKFELEYILYLFSLILESPEIWKRRENMLNSDISVNRPSTDNV